MSKKQTKIQILLLMSWWNGVRSIFIADFERTCITFKPIKMHILLNIFMHFTDYTTVADELDFFLLLSYYEMNLSIIWNGAKLSLALVLTSSVCRVSECCNNPDKSTINVERIFIRVHIATMMSSQELYQIYFHLFETYLVIYLWTHRELCRYIQPSVCVWIQPILDQNYFFKKFQKMSHYC